MSTYNNDPLQDTISTFSRNSILNVNEELELHEETAYWLDMTYHF